MDYHWLPHWKCTVKICMACQIGLARSYAKVGRKMTIILSSGVVKASFLAYVG